MVKPSWSFRHYVSPRGEDVIERWLSSIPARARAKIERELQLLAGEENLSDAGNRVKGIGDGLIEIRVRAERVQYRPIAFYGPNKGEVTLLIGATERDGRFHPPTAKSTAFSRMNDVVHGRANTRDHDEA